MIKKGFMLLLFVLSVTVLTGCDLLNSDIRLFKETYENMKDAKNYEMTLKATEDGRDMTMNVEVDFESDTIGKVKLDNSEDQASYYEVNGDEATHYRQTNSVWHKYSITKDDYYDDPFTFLDYIDYSFLTEKLEYEKLEDEEGYKVYKVSINENTLLPIKYLFEESADKITEEEKADLIALVDCKITIDTNDKVIKKIEFDISKFAEEVKKIDDQSPITSPNNLTLSISYSNFNNVEVYISNEMKQATEEKNYD